MIEKWMRSGLNQDELTDEEFQDVLHWMSNSFLFDTWMCYNFDYPMWQDFSYSIQSFLEFIERDSYTTFYTSTDNMMYRITYYMMDESKREDWHGLGNYTITLIVENDEMFEDDEKKIMSSAPHIDWEVSNEWATKSWYRLVTQPWRWK